MLRNRRHRLARSSGPRRGAALVMFAMLVFVFMAIAALCIDVGMASLAQAQMQSAVDAAALEGVSSRDFFEHRAGSNNYRRNLIRDMARVAFDDDLNPTGPDNDEDHRNYSAGPIYHLEGGFSSIPNASATIVIPEPGSYQTTAERYLDDPVLQINRGHFALMGDLPQGDMVAGTYRPLGSHVEEPLTYLRGDFESASEHLTYPQSNLFEGWKALGVLVRMRRTRLADGPAHLSNPDNNPLVSSSGPTIPFLFGLGSTIHAAEGGDYNPRRDGLTVRATAIASVMPALSASILPFDEGCAAPLIRTWEEASFSRFMYGIGAIALRHDYWVDMPTPGSGNPQDDSFQPVVLDETTGEIKTADLSTVVGRVSLGNSSGCTYGDATSVGQALSPNSPGWAIRMREWVAYLNRSYDIGPDDSLASIGRCYVPIYADIPGPSGTVPRVVGFGYATFRFLDEEADPATAVDFELLKGWRDSNEPVYESDGPCVVVVAPENASVALTSPAPDVTEAEWNLVFAHLMHLTYLDYPEPPSAPPADWVPSFDWRDIRSGALLAPVLVR